MKGRTVKDLCGNEYYVEEKKDIQGVFLEVSEVVNVDNHKMKTYICDIDCTLNSNDDEILDVIDYLKSKFVKD
jgi:hypothetical protein